MACACGDMVQRETQWTHACVALVCTRSARVDAAGNVRVKGERGRGWRRWLRVWVRRDGRVLALGRLWRGTPMWMRPSVLARAGALQAGPDGLWALPGCGCDDALKAAIEGQKLPRRCGPLAWLVAACLTAGAVGLSAAPRPHAEVKTAVGGQTRAPETADHPP